MTRRPPGRSPTLKPAERELYAFACTDGAGNLHWVRVFESSIVRRTLLGRIDGSWGGRLETPDGSSVQALGDGLYVIYSERTLEWIEVEAVGAAPARRRAN